LEPVSASIGITKTKASVATAGRSLSPSALAYSHSQLLSLLLLLPLLLIPVQLARSVEAIQNVKECKRTGQTTMKTKILFVCVFLVVKWAEKGPKGRGISKGII